MATTVRVITAVSCGVATSRSRTFHPDTLRLASSESGPLFCSAPSPPCQRANPSGGSKRTFETILSAAWRDNINRLKDRAFLANRLAKVIVGPSRRLCYRIKDDAISTLVRHGAASVYTVEVLGHGAELGVAFAGGGKLHAVPFRLDATARFVLQQQLISAFETRGEPFGSRELVGEGSTR
jgi:hypothetical protein